MKIMGFFMLRRIDLRCLRLVFLWKIIYLININWVDVFIILQITLHALWRSWLAIDFNSNFRAQLLNLSSFRLRSLYTVKSSSLKRLTLFKMFFLGLEDWCEAIFLLFEVASKRYLIMLQCHRYFRVDLGSLSGTETINLYFLFSISFH